MKRKVLFFLTISLIIFLYPNIDNSYSIQNQLEIILEVDSNDHSNWFWTPYELISVGSTLQSDESSIAIDSSNNIHIVWDDFTEDLVSGSGTDEDIFYRKYNSASKTWSSVELVSSESTEDSEFPSVDVDSLGNAHVIWRDGTDYDTAGTDYDIFYKKRSATGDWTVTSVVSEDSTSSVYSSAIKIDNQNNVMVTWTDWTDIYGAGSDADIFFSFLNASTSEWFPMALVSDVSGTSNDPQIAISPITGYVHIIWNDYTDFLGCGTDSDIFHRIADVSTLSWSSLNVISTESTENSLYPEPCFDNNGKLHVVWSDPTDYNGAGVDDDIFYKQYDPALSIWTTPEIVSSESTGDSKSPQISIDNENTIFVSWQDSTDYGGSGSDEDIFFRYKESGIGLWSTTAIPSSYSDDHSLRTDLAVDSLGHVYTIWKDATDDILGSGTDTDILLRKFVGAPSKPILNDITANPVVENEHIVHWNEVYGATSYNIYRSSSYIWSTEDLTPIITVTENSYADNLNTIGVYYYGIVASNEYGDSDLSNIESVEIVEIETGGLFADFSWGEIIVIAGIVGGLQIILVVTMAILLKPSATPKKKKK